ncbi:MAG: MFS transporter [Candidatus Paracaedibacteraceae bacterium]|nr:MFS transporter [Candidatus Paracaedibacteraceae bacterium]
MGVLSNLDREKKEAVALLQIGTFLEYFDLMLYVHMAVVLNDLFFPKSDPFTAQLLTAFAFSSTFVFKPFGALLFGYLGDQLGRKTTVVITTMVMSVTCFVMATLPTYAQIGITASIGITICRMLQGISSLGESIGSEIYLSEITKPPVRYPAVGLIGTAGAFGSMASLGAANLLMSVGLEWRLVFFLGALIAIVGTVARTRLRETPEFADMKRRMQIAVEGTRREGLAQAADLLKSTSHIWKERVEVKTAVAYFFVFCGFPVCFYISYMYCGNLLKHDFGFTGEEVVAHNFILSVVNFIGLLSFVLLTYKIYPLKILKGKLFLYYPFILLTPFLLNNVSSPISLLFIQIFGVVFGPSTIPGKAIFLVHFPIFKRFTYAGFIAAIAHATVYVVTSFGLVYLTRVFGHWGLLIITLPTTIGFTLGVKYFERLEKNIEIQTSERTKNNTFRPNVSRVRKTY